MHASYSMQKSSAVRPCAARRTPAVPLPRAHRVVRVLSALPEWTGRQFTVLSTSEEATAHLARSIAGAGVQAGDAFCLKGDEKAGKGVFVREFIRAVCDDDGKAIDAPAPGALAATTYTAEDGAEVKHFDLRGAPAPTDEERELLAGMFSGAVSLVESAERLQEWSAAPEQRLAVWIRRLQGADSNADVRLITVVPHTGAWEVRAGLLHANVSRTGGPAGLVVLSDETALSLIRGLPESMLAAEAVEA